MKNVLLTGLIALIIMVAGLSISIGVELLKRWLIKTFGENVTLAVSGVLAIIIVIIAAILIVNN